MLVKGTINHKYQPIGGVYHFSNDDVKKRLGFSRDSSYGDPEDIRGTILCKDIKRFFRWMNQKTDREVGIEREFSEELIQTNILDSALFVAKNLVFDKRIIYKMHWSVHNNVNEVIFFDIYDLQMSEEQKKFIAGLSKQNTDKYGFFTSEEIFAEGVTSENSVSIISNHSKYICKEYSNE